MLRGAHGGLEEEEQASGIQQDEDNDGEDNIKVDEASILEDYKNTFWTRIIAVDGFRPILDDENGYRWPIAQDIIEECNYVAELPVVDPESWAPLYDPNAFNKAHGPLELEKYRLPEDDLEEWAVRVV